MRRQTPEAMIRPMPDATSLACLEVWGGNEPVDAHVRVPGLDAYVYALPFEGAAAGGDVHFVSSCGTGKIARLMLADVSGHGLEVAEMGRTLRSLIRRYMNHVDQRRLLMSMNDAFVALQQSGRFATAVVMTYFAPTQALSLCNAGHPPPLLRRAADGAWRYLDDDAAAALPGIVNIPLGILGDVGYDQVELTLAPGDLVLAYTDSLIEAVCADGEQVGAERLLAAVAKVDTADPTRIVAGVLAQLAAIGATTNDDVTILLARAGPRTSGAPFWQRLGGELRTLAQVLTFRKDAPWPAFRR